MPKQKADRPHKLVSSRALALRGEVLLSDLAVQHALCWMKWRELNKAANAALDPVECAKIQREAVEVNYHMTLVEEALKGAVARAEKRARAVPGKLFAEDTQ